MSYEYDVFISYRRTPAARQWVKDHFHPLLYKWLIEAQPHETKVFLDETGIPVGGRYPDELLWALTRSKILVAVWSAPYPTSAWCSDELGAFLARQQAVNHRRSVVPRCRLVYPVLFHDGEELPRDLQETRKADLRNWAYTAPSFCDSGAYVEFEREIKRAADEVASLVRTAPEWQEKWSRVRPFNGRQTPPAPDRPPSRQRGRPPLKKGTPPCALPRL